MERIRLAGRRPAQRGKRRQPIHRSRGEILFAGIAIIVVLSMVGAAAGTMVIDLTGNGRTSEEDDPVGADDGQTELIANQRATVEANPNDTSAMVLLAKYLQFGNQPEEAISWYEKAIAINPNDISIRLDFANMLTQNGNQSDAELQYRRVLELDPSNIPAIFYLGDLYQYWKPAPRTPEAIAQYQQVLSVAPESVLATTATERLTLLGAPVPATGTPASGTPGAGTPVAEPGVVATPIT